MHMFTGIVESTAKIFLNTKHGLTIARPKMFDDLKIGSSISVSGVCLSIVTFDDASISFDVIDETWKKTTLGNMKTGDYVNLERAVPAAGRFEGHVVQGHVQGTAEVADVKHRKDTSKGSEITLGIPDELGLLVIPKGSIAIDGVSLTVIDTAENNCTIGLIPHTLAHTTLGDLQAGDIVNIETDIFGRYVLSFLLKRR